MKRLWTALLQDRQNLFKHGAIMMIGSAFGAVCNAAFHMVVGRTLDADGVEYGTLVAMLGLILAVSTPMLAVQNTIAHYISRLSQEGRGAEVKGFFRYWMRLFLGISIGLVILAVAARAPLAAFWNLPHPGIIVLTFTVLAGSLWMSLFNGLWQGTESFGWFAFAPQIWSVLRLLLGGLLTAFISATALAALSAQGIGVLAVLLLGLFFWRRLPGTAAPSTRRLPRDMYRYLIAALICLTGYAMLMNLDVTLAKHYFDDETTGLFAKAATIARTAVFLPVPIAATLFPKVTSSGDLPRSSWQLLWRGIGLTVLIILGVVGFCLATPALPWTILYGAVPPEQATQAMALTRAMLLAMMPLALVYVLLNFEMAQQRFRWCYAVSACGVLYVAAVAAFHATPMAIPLALGLCNTAALLLLLTGVAVQSRRAKKIQLF